MIENRGNNQFRFHDITTSAQFANEIAVLDIDRDGDSDLAVATASGLLLYRKSDALQKFREETIAGSTSAAAKVSAEDLDADGVADDLLLTSSDNLLLPFFNDGAGHFLLGNGYGLSSRVTFVRAVDIDNDRTVDWVIGSGGALYRYRGGNAFPTPMVDFIFGSSIQEAEFIDLDKDGDLDLVVSSSGNTSWYPQANLPLPPVQLPQIAINQGDASRSGIHHTTIRFHGLVQVAADAILITRRHENGDAESVRFAFVPSVDQNKNTVISLSFVKDHGPHGLSDGEYVLSIDGSKVSRPSVLMDGDQDGLPGGILEYGLNPGDSFFSLMGDFNGDGAVGFPDFLQFSAAFGSSLPSPLYHRVMDLDADDSIDFADFLQFSGEYGKRRSQFGT